jgi:hypothetical protein
MRTHSRALLLISSLVALNLAAAQKTANPRLAPLIGTWEAITRSTGGLGSTISFAPDNTMSYTLGAMVDMKYRRTRDSLYIIDPQGVVSPFKVSVLRDTLLMTNEGKEQRETRVGAAVTGADPVVGLWTYPHYTGVQAFEEYTPQGEFHLRVPIRTMQGSWVAVGDSAMLHLPGPGGGDRAVRFAVAGDTLQLTWKGQTSRYLRTRPLGR